MLEFLGTVPVDSGQFIVVDLEASADFKKDEFKDFRQPIHQPTNRAIDKQYLNNWEAVIPEFGKSLNALERDGELLINIDEFTPTFSYSGVCAVTLHNEHGVGLVECPKGQVCYASRTAHGDGCFPVLGDSVNGKFRLVLLTALPKGCKDYDLAYDPIQFSEVIQKEHLHKIGNIEAKQLAITDPCYLETDSNQLKNGYVSSLSGSFDCYSLMDEDCVFGVLLTEV